MWLIVPAAGFLAAALIHIVFVRCLPTIGRLKGFLLVGVSVGIGVCGLIFALYGWSLELIAATLIFAGLSEFYIFIFGFVSTSMSARALVRLHREGAIAQDSFSGADVARTVCEQRIDDLNRSGFVVLTNEGPSLTEKGAIAAQLYSKGRKIFNRPSLFYLDRSSKNKESTMVSAKNILALIILTLIPVFLFWPFISGEFVFVGDSDRMNHMMTFYNIVYSEDHTDGFSFWSPHQFGGYSLYTLPYTFPSPINIFNLAWPKKNIYDASAFSSLILIIFCGLSAFLFFRSAITSNVWAGVAGAAVYQTTAQTILKISQNESTFITFIMLPLILCAVFNLRKNLYHISFVGICLSCAIVLWFSFLQMAAYAFILVGAYASFMSLRRQSWLPFVVTLSGGLVSALIAAPRLYGITQEVLNSQRYYGGVDGSNFAQALAHSPKSVEFLRWFDERIFGGSHIESASWSNWINHSEGMLLYASNLAPAIIMFGVLLVLRRSCSNRSFYNLLFFICIILVAFFIVFSRPGYYLIYKLFLGADFLHARILIIANIAQAGVIAIVLAHLSRARLQAAPLQRILLYCSACVAGIILMGVTEVVASTFSGARLNSLWLGGDAIGGLSASALVRILVSLAVVSAAWFALRTLMGPLSSKSLFAVILGSFVVCQSTWFASGHLAGPQHRQGDAPYAQGGRLIDEPTAFRVPSTTARAAFDAELNSNAYRTAVICSDVAIFCSPHVATFWGLRSIEGYISMIPNRLALLPWPSGVLGQRTINFKSADALPWPLLGFMNVKSALVATPEIIRNYADSSNGSYREASPNDTVIIENPGPVTPRFFFTNEIEAIESVDEAVDVLFSNPDIHSLPSDIVERSVVEGFRQSTVFEGRTAGEKIDSRMNNRKIVLNFKSVNFRRFLVINERLSAEWRARIGQTPMKIYPTNVAMVGVEIPAHVESITLEHEPFAIRPISALVVFFGIVIMAFVSFRIARKAHL